jgi:hypothetical protein
MERIRRDGIPRRLNAPTEAELIERCNDLCAATLHEEADCMIDAWMK